MVSTPPNVNVPGGDAKRSYVRDVFAAIAPRYDLLNHVLSLNIDRRWRRAAVQCTGWQAIPGGTYLDVCAGTLDLAAELARQPGFRGRVVGSDFVVPMLQLGLGKAQGLRPVAADTLTLPFADETFDGCMVAFGIRNLINAPVGLAEMARVVRPQRRVVVLEFSLPTAWPIRSLYLSYFRHVLPRIGRLVSKHTSAYEYLPDSVQEFPHPDQVLNEFRAAGLTDTGHRALTFGIASLYWGSRA